MNKNRIKQISTWLRRFVEVDQLTELRALAVDAKETWCGWFLGSEIEKAASAAIGIESRSKGVYFIPNPVSPQKWPAGFGRRGTGEMTSDQDVVSRQWLLIDIDPIRFDGPGVIAKSQGIPTTEEERAAGWDCLCRCRSMLDGFGFVDPVVGDSGNGWHLCYPVDLPNDAQSADQHKRLLATLHSRCADSRASIDLKTFNASRIWKVPGTLTRKGEATAIRPHRYSSILEVA